MGWARKRGRGARVGEGVREAGRRLNDKKVSAHNEGPPRRGTGWWRGRREEKSEARKKTETVGNSARRILLSSRGDKKVSLTLSLSLSPLRIFDSSEFLNEFLRIDRIKLVKYLTRSKSWHLFLYFFLGRNPRTCSTTCLRKENLQEFFSRTMEKKKKSEIVEIIPRE